MRNDRCDTSEGTPHALRVDGPRALLQAVPYLLGFHPSRSLVVVGLHEKQLVVTVRVGLAELGKAPVLSDAIDAMARGGASELVAVLYHDSGSGAVDLASHAKTVEELGASAIRAGCTVIDTLVVSGGRWWSYGCVDTACCPPDGRPVGAETSAFAAAATFAGMVALPDREALAATVQPRPDDERQRLVPFIAAAEDAFVNAVLKAQAARLERCVKRAIFAAARAADGPVTTGDDRLTDAEVARFGVALTLGQVRDALWMAAEDGRIDGRRLWVELARRLPSPYDAAPLFLLGWCSWRAGNGAIAGIAAERALESDPACSAAELLLGALSRGLDPRQVPKLRLPRS